MNHRRLIERCERLSDLRAERLKVARRALLGLRTHRKVARDNPVHGPGHVRERRGDGTVVHRYLDPLVVLKEMDRTCSGVLTQDLSRCARVQLHLKRQFGPVKRRILFGIVTAFDGFEVDHRGIDDIVLGVLAKQQVDRAGNDRPFHGNLEPQLQLPRVLEVRAVATRV